MTDTGDFSVSDLAKHAAEKLVDAMTTDMWPLVRDKLAAVVGLGSRMDADRKKIVQVEASSTREQLLGDWRTRINDALDDDPRRTADLRSALAELGWSRTDVRVSQHIGDVSAGGQAIQVGGNNNFVAGQISQDNRSYRFGLGWLVALLKSHWIVASVVSVVIVGGGAATATQIHRPKKSSATTQASTGSAAAPTTGPAVAKAAVTNHSTLMPTGIEFGDDPVLAFGQACDPVLLQATLEFGKPEHSSGTAAYQFSTWLEIFCRADGNLFIGWTYYKVGPGDAAPPLDVSTGDGVKMGDDGSRIATNAVSSKNSIDGSVTYATAASGITYLLVATTHAVIGFEAGEFR